LIGELRLTGELKSTRSLLGMISKAPKGAKIIVPKESFNEASLLLFEDRNAQVYCASHIKEVVDFMLGETSLSPIKNDLNAIIKSLPEDPGKKSFVDYRYISGQDVSKRAIEIAVAVGH
jgi:predicted ATPase with chaperone activity